jgi:hypothetical protein
MKYRSIASVTSKSAITPSFMGRTAEMFPGVRPSISLAALPTASTFLVPLLRRCTATTEGSLQTMPLPRTNVRMLAVPRSIARSFENRPYTQSRIIWSPFAFLVGISGR